jgi:phospholipid/cholesterol/gamma-HCH transport system substrate-binding protein
MTRDVPRPILACLGVVAAVLISAVAAVLVAYGRGYFDGGYHVTAVFRTSGQGLFTDGGSEVKLRGITIGTVDGIELLPDGRAEFSLLLDPGARVPATAAATIEPLSLFGPKFVQIVPADDGTEAAGPFLDAGDEIRDTSVGLELTALLDQATRILSEVDANEVRSIFDAVAEGVKGLGPEIGSSIDAGADLIDVAHGNQELMAEFLGDLAVASSSFAAHSGAFIDSIDDLRTLAALTNEHGDDLTSLLDTTRAVAAAGTGLLELSSDDFDLTVRSIAAVVDAVFDNRERVPDALDTVGAFFAMLSDPMRLPGPDGTTFEALKGFITLDVCLVYGVCVVPGGAIGADSTTGAAAAGTLTAPRPATVPSLLGSLVGLLSAPMPKGEG